MKIKNRIAITVASIGIVSLIAGIGLYWFICKQLIHSKFLIAYIISIVSLILLAISSLIVNIIMTDCKRVEKNMCQDVTDYTPVKKCSYRFDRLSLVTVEITYEDGNKEECIIDSVITMKTLIEAAEHNVDINKENGNISFFAISKNVLEKDIEIKSKPTNKKVNIRNYETKEITELPVNRKENSFMQQTQGTFYLIGNDIVQFVTKEEKKVFYYNAKDMAEGIIKGAQLKPDIETNKKEESKLIIKPNYYISSSDQNTHRQKQLIKQDYNKTIVV